MSDLQQTVDELRFILQSDGESFLLGIEPTEEFRQLVTAYAPHCKDCNRRLRKCDDALKQGLRSEALHLADASPNLLEVVAILDFPERDQLIEVLAAHSLSKPEPLMLDVAGALNEAYATQEPLTALLDRHRLLALARSPLPQRLNVLRSLADLDSTSPHWETDVRDMERARFGEIDATCRAASARGEVGVLKSLLGELTSTSWRESPPANLLRDLKVRGNQVVRTGARQRLEDLAPQLYQAMSALDLATARTLRDEWVEAIKSAQLPKTDTLAEQVAPVLDWIDDEDRKETQEKSFRKAISALERGLEDDSLSAADLQKLGDDIEKHERGVAEALVNRFQSRLEVLRLNETRKHRMMMVSIAAVVILIGATIGFAVYSATQSRASAQILAAIEGYIADSKLDEARKLLEQHSARATSEDWLAVKKKLAKADQTERDRKVELESVMKAITDAKDPDSALKSAERARELARTLQEKVAVGNLEDQWREKRTTATTSREGEFRTLLQSGTAGLQRLDNLLTNGGKDSELDSLVAQVQQDLTSLNQRQGSVAKELGSQATLLESRLAAFRKARTDTKRRTELLDKLASAAFIPADDATAQSKIDQYFETLREYEVAFPNDPVAVAFKAAAENDALKQVYAKRQMIDRWKGQFWPADMEDLDRRLQECKAFLTGYARSPDQAVVKQYEAILKSVRRREVGDEISDVPIKERFATMFSSPLIGEGHMLRMKDGRIYYFDKELNFTDKASNPANPISLKYLSGYEGETKTRSARVDALEQTKSVPAPQVELAARAAKEIPKLSIEAWDEHHQKLTAQLLNAKSVDPFLRYFLVLRTMKYAGLGNSLLEAQLVQPLKLLNEGKVDLSVAWMDPDDEAARKVRNRAADLISELKPEVLNAAWDKLAQSQKALSQGLFAVPSPIGCLERSANGSWKVRSEWNPEKEHQLYCATSTVEGGNLAPLVWRHIGRKFGKDFAIDFAKDFGITEGMVVFASAEPLRPAPTK